VRNRVLALIVSVAMTLGFGALLVIALRTTDAGRGATSSSRPTDRPTTATPGTATGATPTATATPEPPRRIALGAYIADAPSDPSKIDAYAKLTGAMPHIVMWYQAWETEFGAFDPKSANAVRSRGAMPIISWEPWIGKSNDPDWALSTIIGGAHDTYIHQWTRAVAAWRKPIYVRLMYEMNGRWTSWSPGLIGNTPEQFVLAWRHIVDIARGEGATNIRWVWAPNVDNGDPNLSSYESVYPGDDYVDWVGLDGFNWGTSKLTTSWIDASTLFRRSVDEVRALTAKPLMIAEIGATELGGDKAAWITDGFAQIVTAMPEVQAVTWFDSSDPRREVDWRVDSSPRSLAAFRAVATSEAFSGTLP
jgi:Glycosyl hydrolase family 26